MEAATEKRAAAWDAPRGSRIFRRNVGGIDRLARVVAGITLASVGLLHMSRGSGGGLIAFVGVFVLVMACIGYCPLYVPFGISTARKASARGTPAVPGTTASSTGRSTNRS